MKPVSLIIIYLCIFVSCNQKKNSTSSETARQDSTGAPGKDKKSEIQVNTDDQSSALAKMAPLSEEEMRSRLPENLLSGTISEIDLNASMGSIAASASYRLSDSTELDLTIIDCAGPAGAGIYNMQYIGMLGISEEDDNEYTRTIDFNGNKAFETCDKKRVHCTLTFFTGRFLVSLEGDLAVQQLKQAASSLNL